MSEPERRLAAILNADVVGYSRLMADDEEATVRTLRAYREEIELLLHQHRGRLVDFTGDNFLAEFRSAVEAVSCAVEIQGVLRGRNELLPEERRMEFRMGLHLGELQSEDERLFGTSVNVAARLEGLAAPGGVCISEEVHREVVGRTPFEFRDLGDRHVKNIPERVHAYAVDVPHPPLVRPGRRPTWQMASAIGVLILLGGAAWWALERAEVAWVSEGERLTSLVVLPFDDLSPGADQGYFAHGISAELTSALSRVRELRVVGRTSAEAVKGRGLTIAEIGGELDVQGVVEGSVRRADGQLRITVRLVATDDGYQLWSDSYDRPIGDVFRVQEEIAQTVARFLAGPISPPWPFSTRDPRAFDAYLLGRHLFSDRTATSLQRAIEAFERAIDLDPEYAKAHAGLADAHREFAWRGLGNLEEELARHDAALERAVAMNDQLAEVQVTLGVSLQYEGDQTGALRAFERAIELDPGLAEARARYGVQLFRLNRTEESLAELRRALDLDPLSSAINTFAAYVHSGLRELDTAEGYFEKALELSPESPYAYVALAAVRRGMGRTEAAIDTLLSQSLPGEAASILKEGAREGGWSGAMGAMARLMIADPEKPCGEIPLNSFMLFAVAEEDGMALECLAAASRAGVVHPLFVPSQPTFDPFRDDPRFEALLRKAGLPD